ncbi:hypothetical protein [uncultured Chryseobacterium sp.]|uniref:hypothetical protein n=1 Tax=uncultured Chryseobacterium sp. TaxID=259322 RepID=UPI0025D5D15A|nr:hypothetical protein [uncultured Chryseobacterium sp.]
MNNLEINSYISAKKKSKLYIENEISGAQQVLYDLKEHKPVRCYNNAYSFVKGLFLFSWLLLPSSF